MKNLSRRKQGSINIIFIGMVILMISVPISYLALSTNTEKNNTILKENIDSNTKNHINVPILDVNKAAPIADTPDEPIESDDNEEYQNPSPQIPPDNNEIDNDSPDQPPVEPICNECDCDLNCDGFVDDKDLLILQAYYDIAYIPLTKSPDFNDDGIVDLSDLATILAVYGPCEDDCPEDLVTDNIIDNRDLKIVKAYYDGPFYPICNSPDINDDGIVDLSDLAELLAYYD